MNEELFWNTKNNKLYLDPNIDDTITAISTPIGTGGIGIIRISGPNSLTILKKISNLSNNITPRYVHFAGIYELDSKNMIDQACVIYFKAPNSYTGEDLVELQVHSSPYILKTVLEQVLNAGARMAKKGEFTKKAFLHGKMNLIEAENVIDLINSNNKASHMATLDSIKGKLFNTLSELRTNLSGLLEHIEASIDFNDDVDGLDRQIIDKTINQSFDTLNQIINDNDIGLLEHYGYKCLIVGAPNVGKSTLINAIAETQRAIVSEIPGTTRDFIDIKINLADQTFEFIDTAGIRKNIESEIEAQGINKISDLILKADIIFWVIDQSKGISNEDYAVYEKIKNKKTIYLILNKTDLTNNIQSELKFENILDIIKISAKKNIGIDILKKILIKKFCYKNTDENIRFYCNLRQITTIKKAKEKLENIKNSLSKQIIFDDCLALDLKEVIILLGEITGQEVSEEILDGIFSRFCIGK